MTAISSDVTRSMKVLDLAITPLAMTADTKIPRGALVVSNAAGTAENFTQAAAKTFQGVAHDGFDNTGGLVGAVGANASARVVQVNRKGVYSFAVSGATPLPGQTAYGVDNNTVAADAAVTDPDIAVGKFIEPNGLKSGEWFVDIEAAF